MSCVQWIMLERVFKIIHIETKDGLWNRVDNYQIDIIKNVKTFSNKNNITYALSFLSVCMNCYSTVSTMTSS